MNFPPPVSACQVYLDVVSFGWPFSSSSQLAVLPSILPYRLTASNSVTSLVPVGVNSNTVPYLSGCDARVLAYVQTVRNRPQASPATRARSGSLSAGWPYRYPWATSARPQNSAVRATADATRVSARVTAGVTAAPGSGTIG